MWFPLILAVLVSFWSTIAALVIAVIVIALARMEAEIEGKRSGDDRRLSFPPMKDSHPHPSPSWTIADSLRYQSGFVDVDGIRIWWQSFSPINPKGIVITLHGYADHSDYRMYELSHDISNGGDLIVIALDQPGFGRSDGLWGYIPDWHEHVDICVRAIRLMLDSNSELSLKNLPVFCYGHSMGGGLAISISVRYPTLFQGIVLSAPMCGINPELRRSWIVEKFFFALADWFPRLPITPVPDLSRLCYKDPAFHAQERIKNKLAFPLKPRLGTARSMLRAQAWIGENAHMLTVPFLIIHGDHDVVTSHTMSVKFQKRAGSKDTEVELIKGGYHIMMGYGMDDKINGFLLHRITNWIRSRIQIAI